MSDYLDYDIPEWKFLDFASEDDFINYQSYIDDLRYEQFCYLNR